MPITIQEIIASDTISQLVDKTNFNFDQLLLNGGGPAGPPGIQGPIGPAGGRGPKGSTWYEDTSAGAPGNNPNTAPPTATPLTGDYYLQFDGWVWEYLGTVWVQTTINLTGPVGPDGPAGGFGLAFGANPSILLNKNTLYNGQLGTLTTGADSSNEGVPSIMMGGVSSIYTNPDGAMQALLTNAYVLPVEIELGLTSDVASVLIHQKSSAGKAIVFHGGAADSTDYFEQLDVNSLSNISIGVDDRLIIDVPKSTGIPGGLLFSMSDLIGFQVDSQYRSQSYNAGQQIRFVTGQDSSNYYINDENSNFEISVGAGSAGTNNKFKVSTLSSGGITSMEMGGGVTLLNDQSTNGGTYQLLSGITRFVTTNSGGGTGEFSVRSQGNIRLNTFIAGSPVTANIGLISGNGGITANSTGGGITITQSVSTSANNILIDQNSNVGNLKLRSNSNTILQKLNDANTTENPSITLDYTAVTSTRPHIRLVGRQSWAPTGMSTEQPNLTLNIQQANYMSNTLLAGTTFRQVGESNNTSYEQNSAMEKWVGGTQDSTGIDAGLITIINANEGLLAPSNFMYDNSLELSIRDSSNTEDYISLSKSKLGLATPIVHKRARGLNSTTNSVPSNMVGGVTNEGKYNYLNQYGWNTEAGLSEPEFATTGMPTIENLNVPFITLAYGDGVGLQISRPGAPTQTNEYDHSFKFPTGAYPGQQLILKFIQYSSYSSTSGVATDNYGTIHIKIPQYRRRTLDAGTGFWSDWWTDNITPSTGTNPTYYDLTNSTYKVDAVAGAMISKTVVMVWDGGIVQLPGAGGASKLGAVDNAIQVQQEMGWIILSSITQRSVMNFDYPGDVPLPGAIVEAKRSIPHDNVAPTLSCNTDTNDDIWIATQTFNTIAVNDYVYDDGAGASPFAGDNKFYRVVLDAVHFNPSAALTGDKIVQINNGQIASVISSCGLGPILIIWGSISASHGAPNCLNSIITTDRYIATGDGTISNGDVMMIDQTPMPGVPMTGTGGFYTFDPLVVGAPKMTMTIDANGIIGSVTICP